MALKVIQVPGSGMYANSYLLVCDQTREAALIDPADARAAMDLAAQQGAVIKMVLLTHGHFDHIVGLDSLRDALKIPACIHSEDAPMLGEPSINGSVYFGMPVRAGAAQQLLSDDQVIKIGEGSVRVIHTPGHSPGSVCYLALQPEDTFLITGDTLFNESIGRTDLWRGDMLQLMQSIRQKLFVLPGEIPCYPGHGPSTTIAHEISDNPLVGQRGGLYDAN